MCFVNWKQVNSSFNLTFKCFFLSHFFGVNKHRTLVSAIPVKWHPPAPSSSPSQCQSCFLNADKQLLVFVSCTLYIGKTIFERNCRGRNHYLCTIVATWLLGLLKISISFVLLSKNDSFFALYCSRSWIFHQHLPH